MSPIQKLLTDHFDIWAAADTEKKSGRGRSSGNAASVYGIKKLRELILELAVRGKLVPQDPNDEPARELLKRIQAQMNKLSEEGKIKRSKLPAQIVDTEKPYELPHGWRWVRLSQVSQANTGYAFKSSEYRTNGTLVLRVTNINPDGTLDLMDAKYIDPVEADSTYRKFLLSEDDVLLVMVGGSLGKLGVVEKSCLPAVLNQNMWKMDRFGDIAKDYFLFGLRQINSSQIEVTHSTHGHLAQGEYLSKLFPLPPLAEQHRIVAKVDELKALCDQLEFQHNNAAEAHEKLVSDLLGTLTQSQSAADFTHNWQRIAVHFDTLFTTEASIDALKQSLLQLAVMGKLVPQDPNDEPAEVFYKRTLALPEGYVKSNKQAIRGFSAFRIENLPVLPKCWTYIDINGLYVTNHILEYGDGNHGSLYPRKGDFGQDGVLFLTAAQIDNKGGINWEDCPRLSYEKAKILTKGWSKEGDVYFTHNATVGRTAIAEECLDKTHLLGTSVTFYRLNKDSINTRYFYLYLSSFSWYSQAEAVMRQTTRNQVSITKQALFYVALPPLREQNRIVKIVDELIPLIEQLSRLVRDLQNIQVQLTDTIVEQAVA
ncbi:MAG: restriction endonuclease subunit S [Gammaproteobacteria bacterium]|nr:restriction endonuclease subunit S [Gammaproteobacteria bacterium]MDP2346388.1 restriction endonuclease subunit S [Gammaproteobacteria bacterium]